MISKPVPLGSFSPDLDPRDPSTLVDMDGFIPSMKGLRTAPGFVPVATATLATPALGTYAATLVSGARIVVTGTVDHLYQLQNMAWVEFDGGQVFSAVRWRYATFGNDILAVNGSDPPQVSRNGQPFRPLANLSDVPPLGPGAPQVAALVAVVDQGVFMVPPESDQWYFSSSDTIWTPSIATETVTARITGTPGPITGLQRIRGGIVMFKTESFYMGQFSNPPFFWYITSISENIGVRNNECVVNASDLLLWFGRDDFYQFDGSSLQRIPNALKEWLLREADPKYLDTIMGRWDGASSLAVWHFSSIHARPAGTLDMWVAYSSRTDKWTKGNTIVEDLVQPNMEIRTDITYAGLGELYDRYADLPNVPYNWIGFGSSVREVAGIIDPNHTLNLATGPSTGSYLVSGEITDGSNYLQLSRVRPIFAMYPTDNFARLRCFKRRMNGYPIPDINAFPLPGVGPVATLTRDGAFNIIQTARSHQLRVELTADAEITALALDVQPVGEE